MVRPSFKETLSASAEKPTAATRSSAFNAKMPIPCLYKPALVLFYQGLYCTKLLSTKSEVSCKCHRLKPELRRQIISVNVDMASLIRFVAIEIKPVRATSQDSWHGRILQNCAYFRTGVHSVCNSDPFDLQENQPKAAGATSDAILGTQGSGGNARASRVWKGAISLEMCRFPADARFQRWIRAVLFSSACESVF